MSDTIKSPPGQSTTRETNRQIDLYQKFMDSLEPVALLLRPQTREIVAVNKSGQNIGVTVGTTCYESWAKRKTPCPWCQAPKVWKNGETARCQAEGEGRIWDAHWVSITEDLYLHYVHDITEEVENEKALKESEEKYRMLIENMNTGLVIVDTNNQYTFVNDKFAAMVGYAVRDLVGKSIATILDKENLKIAEAQLEARAKGSFEPYEIALMTRKGDQIEVIVSPKQLTDSEGKHTGSLAVVTDITERKRAETEVKASKRKLQSYFDNAPDGIVVVDGQGLFVEVNPAFCKLTGHTKKELLTMRIPEMLAPESREAGVTHFGQVVNEGFASGEFVGLCKDGTKIHYIVDAVKVGDNRFLGFIKDITIRKQNEIELQTYAHNLGERIKELRGLYGLSKLTGNSDQTPEIVFQRAVELLPPAWHYPKITCAKISMYGKEYTTANYAECAWKQVAEIRAFNDEVGSIEVGYLDEMPQLHEGPFLLEERQLIDTMALELGQYQAEYKLRENHTRFIEGQLTLENRNTALAELVDHSEREKQELACRIQSNADRVIGPMLTRLETQLDEAQKGQLAMIRSSLDDLTSPFISRLEQGMTRLTPREVEICNLIKNGYSSKDIAETLHTAEATVRTQRKTIRRKLGLAKKKTNLATYFQQN